MIRYVHKHYMEILLIVYYKRWIIKMHSSSMMSSIICGEPKNFFAFIESVFEQRHCLSMPSNMFHKYRALDVAKRLETFWSLPSRFNLICTIILSNYYQFCTFRFSPSTKEPGICISHNFNRCNKLKETQNFCHWWSILCNCKMVS